MKTNLIRRRCVLLSLVPGLVGLALCSLPRRAAAQTVPLAGNHPANISSLPLAGPLDPQKQLTLDVVFALRDDAGRAQLQAEQQDPSSPNYHRWLTPEQFNARFGPSPADFKAVDDWLSERGFTIVERNPLVRYIRFRDTVARVQSAFQVSLVSVGNSGFANTNDPLIPARFHGALASIQGLDNLHAVIAQNRFIPKPQASWGTSTAFAPSDLHTFYDETPVLNLGIDGAGDCIAIVGDSDYLPSAVSLFNSTFGVPAETVNEFLSSNANGAFTNPGRNGDEVEALLDLEWSHAAAPGATVNFYLGDNDNTVVGSIQDAIMKAVADNECSVISISFVWCDGTDTLADVFEQAKMQGQSVFAISGDNGAAGYIYNASSHKCVVGSSRTVNDPAQDPNVTAVGGTSFSPTYDASGNDVSTVSDTTRVVWNSDQQCTAPGTPSLCCTGAGTGTCRASGGGASTVFSKPSYQQGVTPSDGARDVPDVALLADPSAPGVFLGNDPVQQCTAPGTPSLCCTGAGTGTCSVAIDCCYGGTSLSSPVFAGFTKLIEQYMGQRLGNINAEIYALASSNGASNGFRDITSGDNTYNNVSGFTAGPGYDQVTGWGEVDVNQFVTAFATTFSTPLGTPTPTNTPTTPTPVLGGTVVGTGTAGSCTEAALDAALANGGNITFNCGGSPVPITVTSTKTISADTTIDGRSLITISGGNSVGVFSVNTGVNFTVENLTIANGTGAYSDPDGYLDGGGIANFGTLTVTNSTFSGNGVCGGPGGAIYNEGTLTITDSSFAYNYAGPCEGWTTGGAIYNDGTLTITNSTFSGNSAGEGGGAGAIYNDGTLTITNSTFSGNSTSGRWGGGSIWNYGGTLTITNSTFSGNSASGIGNGGGIYNGPGISDMAVTNSTFFNNSAAFSGGAIANDGGVVTITNSTLSGNSASIYGGAILNGGGVSDLDSTLTVTNTIVANSTSAGNCWGSPTDGGHNIDDDGSCSFSGISFSNTNPMLDPAGLRNNGGPTQTIGLCTGTGAPSTGCTGASPAINAGDESVCSTTTGIAPVDNRDQRGYGRPGTGATRCSIGAFEVNAAAPTPTRTPTPTPSRTAPRTPTKTPTATPTNTRTPTARPTTTTTHTPAPTPTGTRQPTKPPSATSTNTSASRPTATSTPMVAPTPGRNTLSAASVRGTAGQTVGVPITLNTGSDNADFFAVTFTVVAQGGAPAITTALTYTPADGIPNPDLSTAVAASGELAIGYLGLASTLTGVLQIGTLNVPVPAGATGSYVVQLARISAGDLAGNKVTLTGVNGAITLSGGPTVAPTRAPTPGPNTLSAASVSGTAGQTVGVPIELHTGSGDVDFFAVTFTVVAQGGAPAITTALTYTPADAIPKPDLSTAVAASGELAIGYLGLASTLTGVLQIGTLNVPVPAGATGSYVVQLARISAGDLAGNKVTLTGMNGAITLSGGPTVSSAPAQGGGGGCTISQSDSGGSLSSASLLWLLLPAVLVCCRRLQRQRSGHDR
jgi:hypothetical protein